MLENVHDSVLSVKFSTKIQCIKFPFHKRNVTLEFDASYSDGVCCFISLFCVIVIINSHPTTSVLISN